MDIATRIAIIVVAQQLVMWVLKHYAPALGQSKTGLRAVVVILTGLGVLIADWQPDGIVNWLALPGQWFVAVLGAEWTYQWIAKKVEQWTNQGGG